MIADSRRRFCSGAAGRCRRGDGYYRRRLRSVVLHFQTQSKRNCVPTATRAGSIHARVAPRPCPVQWWNLIVLSSRKYCSAGCQVDAARRRNVGPLTSAEVGSQDWPNVVPELLSRTEPSGACRLWTPRTSGGTRKSGSRTGDRPTDSWLWRLVAVNLGHMPVHRICASNPCASGQQSHLQVVTRKKGPAGCWSGRALLGPDPSFGAGVGGRGPIPSAPTSAAASKGTAGLLGHPHGGAAPWLDEVPHRRIRADELATPIRCVAGDHGRPAQPGSTVVPRRRMASSSSSGNRPGPRWWQMWGESPLAAVHVDGLVGAARHGGAAQRFGRVARRWRTSSVAGREVRCDAGGSGTAADHVRCSGRAEDRRAEKPGAAARRRRGPLRALPEPDADAG